jgi:hypothetical protein
MSTSLKNIWIEHASHAWNTKSNEFSI